MKRSSSAIAWAGSWRAPRSPAGGRPDPPSRADRGTQLRFVRAGARIARRLSDRSQAGCARPQHSAEDIRATDLPHAAVAARAAAVAARAAGRRSVRRRELAGRRPAARSRDARGTDTPRSRWPARTRGACTSSVSARRPSPRCTARRWLRICRHARGRRNSAAGDGGAAGQPDVVRGRETRGTAEQRTRDLRGGRPAAHRRDATSADRDAKRERGGRVRTRLSEATLSRVAPQKVRWQELSPDARRRLLEPVVSPEFRGEVRTAPERPA